jgi:hypothetical protein
MFSKLRNVPLPMASDQQGDSFANIWAAFRSGSRKTKAPA